MPIVATGGEVAEGLDAAAARRLTVDDVDGSDRRVHHTPRALAAMRCRSVAAWQERSQPGGGCGTRARAVSVVRVSR